MQDECYNSSLWMSVRVPGKVVKVPTGLKACPHKTKIAETRRCRGRNEGIMCI